MIKKVRIAVDHGNRNMKTCSQVFTTGLTIQDKKPARGEKFLFYEGKYYVLSENRIPYQRDKTQDDRFFILTLFAIVKELEENSQIQPEDVIQVDLPIGLPPKHYAELCERYEAYFKRQGKIHDINYCGSTYHITIGEVMAFPQDYAAMMTMIEKLQQIPKVVGIDIGGFTTDYLLMRKGNPDMEACDSMEKGVITMYNKIISGINSEYDILLEESDIDSILQGNTEFYEEAVVRMTEGMVQDFVSYYKTGNAFLDNLLHAKRLEALEKKIEFKVFADFTPFKRVKNEDLCVIVSNTIDNALRECQLMKADNPKIECLVQLKARKIKGFLSIICENSLRESQAEALRGNLVMETSKEDKKNHGFGVKNIKRVVREYGGEVSSNVVDDMFSVSILIPIEV